MIQLLTTAAALAVIMGVSMIVTAQPVSPHDSAPSTQLSVVSSHASAWSTAGRKLANNAHSDALTRISLHYANAGLDTILADLSKSVGATRIIGPYHVSVTAFKKNGDASCFFQFDVKNSQTDPVHKPDEPRDPLLYWSVVDAQGHIVTSSRTLGGTCSENLPISAESTKLVLKYPAEREERDISFEFKDIPMP